MKTTIIGKGRSGKLRKERDYRQKEKNFRKGNT